MKAIILTKVITPAHLLHYFLLTSSVGFSNPLIFNLRIFKFKRISIIIKEISRINVINENNFKITQIFYKADGFPVIDVLLNE